MRSATLTTRETHIARLIAWGYVQKEIADMLNISIQTVSVHLRNIYSKLQIHKETDLTRYIIFHEYCIADDFKKVIVGVLFLLLSCSAILTEGYMVRIMPNARVCTRARARRARRVPNVFDLALAA